jgi:hypothetical membrane protein
MSIRSLSLSRTLIFVAAVMVVLETFYFASLRPGYSHISNTISELGETAASRARLVAYVFFLPVGLMVWLALWLIHRERSDQEALPALVALSCLGTGYVVSVFAPCDPGAPLFGSWRTLVHNFGGLIDYGGTGIGFLLVARRRTKNEAATQTAGFVVAGVACLVGLVLLLPAFPIRGGVQRAVEIIQFTGVFVYLAAPIEAVAPKQPPKEKL